MRRLAQQLDLARRPARRRAGRRRSAPCWTGPPGGRHRAGVRAGRCCDLATEPPGQPPGRATGRGRRATPSSSPRRRVPAMAELVVAPRPARRGDRPALVAGSLAGRRAGTRVWAHGDLPPPRRVARSLGLHAGARELLQMRRSAGRPELPDAAACPPDVTPAHVSRSGRGRRGAAAGERRRVRLAPRAGRLDRATTSTSGSREPWFDPAGLFWLADDADRRAAGLPLDQGAPPHDGPPSARCTWSASTRPRRAVDWAGS